MAEPISKLRAGRKTQAAQGRDLRHPPHVADFHTQPAERCGGGRECDVCMSCRETV